MSVRVNLFGAPPLKDFEARPPKKSEGFRVRHGSGKWLALGQPGGVGRGQGFLRTARALEVARTWPSCEMVRDTAQSFTRRYEMVRDTVTVY